MIWNYLGFSLISLLLGMVGLYSWFVQTCEGRPGGFPPWVIAGRGATNLIVLGVPNYFFWIVCTHLPTPNLLFLACAAPSILAVFVSIAVETKEVRGTSLPKKPRPTSYYVGLATSVSLTTAVLSLGAAIAVEALNGVVSSGTAQDKTPICVYVFLFITGFGLLAALGLNAVHSIFPPAQTAD